MILTLSQHGITPPPPSPSLKEYCNNALYNKYLRCHNAINYTYTLIFFRWTKHVDDYLQSVVSTTTVRQETSQQHPCSYS